MRCGTCVLFLLMLVCGIFILNNYYHSLCTSQILADKDQNESARTKFLIIVGEARSGSTWLGSFFKENENALHFFEPLDTRVFEKVVNTSSRTPSQIVDMQLSVLSNECKCTFDGVKYPSMGILPSWSKSLHRLQGYLSEDGKVLPQFRRPKMEDLAAKLKMKAPNLGEVEELCKTVDLVSAKIIRLYDIAHLARLPDYGCHDYKILHLVRDPRPIILSRMNVFGELLTGNGNSHKEFEESEIREVSRTICQNFVRNLHVGMSSWFQSKYKVVRYEDIASDPLGYAQQIYDYVGVPLTSAVRNHILKSSQGSTVVGKYEVIRNTSEVVNNWKKVMDARHVKIVESQCTDMFRTFGYQTL